MGVTAGCILANKTTQSAPLKNEPSGSPAYSAAELSADKLPYKSARLILSGTEVPVTMNRKVSGKRVDFLLTARQELLEIESYESDDKGFRFAGLSGETFEPAIPIARFPFRVGEAWEWTGTAGLGPILKPATAKLSSSKDKLNLATGVAECILISADLDVKVSEKSQSKRILKFWIEPGIGVVKRDFAMSSTREPRPETESAP